MSLTKHQINMYMIFCDISFLNSTIDHRCALVVDLLIKLLYPRGVSKGNVLVKSYEVSIIVGLFGYYFLMPQHSASISIMGREKFCKCQFYSWGSQ